MDATDVKKYLIYDICGLLAFIIAMLLAYFKVIPAQASFVGVIIGITIASIPKRKNAPYWYKPLFIIISTIIVGIFTVVLIESL